MRELCKEHTVLISRVLPYWFTVLVTLWTLSYYYLCDSSNGYDQYSETAMQVSELYNNIGPSRSR